MKSDRERFLFRKEILNGVIFILGVLLLVVVFIQPGTAEVSANFTAMNQAGMPLSIDYSDNTCTFPCGDYLIISNNSTVKDNDRIVLFTWKVDDDVVTPLNTSNIFKGPFSSDPVSVQLIATNSTGTQSSKTVVFTPNACGLVSVNFTAVAAYDDRTKDPNGTITFWDNSHSIADRELNINQWWWKGTNTLTGEVNDSSGQDHFTMNMTNKTGIRYLINLTVGNSAGAYSSISDNVTVPPDNVIPIADFAVTPKSGVGPLNVSVIDQSYSMVNYTVSNVSIKNYNYTVYNSTGVQILPPFEERNPVILLPINGTYSIKSNITNWYGISNETTVGGINVFNPDGPIANFSTTVREGLAPLNITLIDQSIASVDEKTGDKNLTYFWEVGNSTGYYKTSKDFNPQFNLLYPGYNNSASSLPPYKYWVNLTITDQNGKSDLIHKSDYITVGVEKYPKAAFTAVPMNGSYPLNVSFIDQSVLDPDLLATIGPANYTWTFDDGGISHLQNPTHVFTSPRNYNVSMNLSHGELQSGPATQVIHVTDPSDSGINFTWVQEYGKTAYSAVLIPLGITADWDVNWRVEKDGTPYSPVDASAFTPRYDLPGTGIYTVTLSASKDGFTSSAKTQQMEIFPRIRPENKMTMLNTNSASLMDKDEVWAYAYPGDPIQFWSNKSNSMEDSWLWDFGDNSSSPLRSPLHTYNAPGLYTVTLKSSNVKGETIAGINQLPYIPYDQKIVTDTYNVWILHELDVDPVGILPSGVAPHTVQFSETISVNGKSDAASREYVNRWYWDFDYDLDKYLNVYDYNHEKPDAFAGETDPVYPILYTGEGASVEEAPSYTYKKPGVYHPVLWVQLKKDYWSWHPFKANDIIVSGTLKPAFTYEIIDRDGTYGYSYKFMDTSESACENITSWDWDFGDKTPHSYEPAPTHMFKEPGIYTVTLSVCDDCVPQNCGSTSENIRVEYDGQPALAAGFSANMVTNEPYTVQFIDQSVGPVPLSYSWNFGDSGTSSDKNPKHPYSSSGTKSVTLTVTDSSGFSNQTSQSINVNNVPVVDFTTLKIDNKPMTLQFIDQSVGIVPSSYTWDYDTTVFSNDRNPKYTFNKVGTYNVTLSITDDKSNKYNKTQKITVPSVTVPNANFDYNLGSAGSRLVKFNDTSIGEIYSWKWIFGDGFGSSIQSPEHIFPKAGNYTVSLTVGNNVGSNSKSTIVTVP